MREKMEKRCVACGKSFIPAKFHSTIQKVCSSECRGLLRKKLYYKNQEKELANKKTYYQANKDKLHIKNTKYRKLNRDKINKQKMKHYYKNREEIIRKQKRNYENSKQNIDFLLKMRWINRGHKKAGITLKELLNFFYNNWKTQEGKCAICGKKFANISKAEVDHLHNPHKLRGLLCTNCNGGIEKFNENEEYLSNAIKYLEQYENSR
ncbi:TPA: hypothetical protein HA235_07745 [Candidatus Woesearchaeota archaeon]|nr:hypothetical protein [Candidatus Woesearchaeota archaeon]HIH32572.1 hypothetical protein [Candidatus Woesearchaeota archaeon]HIH54807.1 hypothetical protein [Candidatus Woesearchaeota archaeon]